jgi:hypothetical protein
LLPHQKNSNKRTNKKSSSFDYDMVQAETRWIRNTDKYDAKQNTLVTVFNNILVVEWDQSYFKLLEKALAYSTFGYYVAPQRK